VTSFSFRRWKSFVAVVVAEIIHYIIADAVNLDNPIYQYVVVGMGIVLIGIIAYFSSTDNSREDKLEDYGKAEGSESAHDEFIKQLEDVQNKELNPTKKACWEEAIRFATEFQKRKYDLFHNSK